MFYARINKIKIFNNREGVLGLFNRAEMRIYAYVTVYFGEIETRRARSLRGNNNDAHCLNSDLCDYMRTMIYLRSSQSRRDFVYLFACS